MASPYSYVLAPDISDVPRFQDLTAYWQRKRGGRALPLRKDIDPLELQAHLGSLVIVECLPDLADFRYRLIGTSVVEAYGRDSTGKTVRELYETADPDYFACLMEAYRAVATQHVAARIRATLRPVNKNFRLADSLLLPLDGGDGTVRWLLNEVLFR